LLKAADVHCGHFGSGSHLDCSYLWSFGRYYSLHNLMSLSTLEDEMLSLRITLEVILPLTTTDIVAVMSINPSYLEYHKHSILLISGAVFLVETNSFHKTTFIILKPLLRRREDLVSFAKFYELRNCLSGLVLIRVQP